MNFEKYYIDAGGIYSTYPDFFDKYNINHDYYRYGSDGFPLKNGKEASYCSGGMSIVRGRVYRSFFDEAVEDSNTTLSDLKRDPKLLKKWAEDWVYFAGPYIHEENQYGNILCLVKTFKDKTALDLNYQGVVKILIEENTVIQQNKFRGYSNIWRNVF